LIALYRQRARAVPGSLAYHNQVGTPQIAALMKRLSPKESIFYVSDDCGDFVALWILCH
jgi:hypothetical protein